MGKKLLVLVVLFFVSAPVFGQCVDTAWVRRNDGLANSSDWGWAVAVDDSGNAYATGSTYVTLNNIDQATIKYHPNGDTAWVRTYDGPAQSSDWGKGIVVDHFGNVCVTGWSLSSETSWDYATIKYYPDGDTAWVRRYEPGIGEDDPSGIKVDASDNIYVTGKSWSEGTGYDYATVKYYPNGDTAWVRRYNGPLNSTDEASAIAVDDSGNVYVTGTTFVTIYDLDYATIKYYPNGDTAWVRRYNGPGTGEDRATAIAVDGSGFIYVTGSSYSTLTGRDYTTIKYHPNGDTAWVRTYTGPVNNEDWAKAIALDDSGNIFVTGFSIGSGTMNDYATVKYYPNGDTAWVRRYNGSKNSDDRAFAIAIDDSGDVYVTGYSIGDTTSWDFVTIKYYPNGNIAWIKSYNGPANSYDEPFAITVDRCANVYVTGQSYDSVTGFDFTTIKYVQYLAGDVNRDSKTTISDVVYLINYLFKGGPAPNPIQSADVNGDDKVTVSDVVYLINYLFKGGPPPIC